MHFRLDGELEGGILLQAYEFQPFELMYIVSLPNNCVIVITW